MSRKTAREHAFKIIFEFPFLHEEESGLDEVINLYLENFSEKQPSEGDLNFISAEVAGVRAHLDELDEIVEGALRNWSLKRLSKVDLALLRLGAYEIMYDPEIAVAVTVNEIVNYAKEYSQPASPSFINGVLGSVAAAHACAKNVTNE